MKMIDNMIKILLMLVLMVAVSGCGDKKGPEYWVEALTPVIDLKNPYEDKVSMVTATVFDTQGNPVKSGTMNFSLSQNANGYFLDDKGNKTNVLSVKLDDGVAEVVYYATNKPETVVVYAYCPGYPRDSLVGASINVIHGTFFAEFSLNITTDDVLTVYDQSGFDETIGQSITSWDWSIQDSTGTTVATRTGVLPIPPFNDRMYPQAFNLKAQAKTNCTVTLIIHGSDGSTATISHPVVVP